MKKVVKVIFVCVVVLTLLMGVYMFYVLKSIQQSKGTLIVGTDATYPPMESVVDGKVVGFDIDLAEELGREMGYKIEFKNIPFDNIFERLDAGEIDMVISSVTITSERRKKMLFSSPYLNAGQVIVVMADNRTIFDTKDLNSKKIGVQKGTTSEVEAAKYTDQSLIVSYPDYEVARKDMLYGKIEAIIMDYPAAGVVVKESLGKLKLIGKPFTSEYYGIVLPIGEEKMMGKVNTALSVLKRREILSELEAKWFKE